MIYVKCPVCGEDSIAFQVDRLGEPMRALRSEDLCQCATGEPDCPVEAAIDDLYDFAYSKIESGE